jgi:hypothetical protein
MFMGIPFGKGTFRTKPGPPAEAGRSDFKADG